MNSIVRETNVERSQNGEADIVFTHEVRLQCQSVVGSDKGSVITDNRKTQMARAV
ncbi:MAG: hypothetical protein FWH31_02920 [Streptococcaceae bacterium]|nr:hypothetical protein [Streptococcaceae bacterium]